jgi:hypothetical protein
MTHCPGMSLKKEEFYAPEDLVCGGRVNIFGRDFMIHDVDEHTRKWYKAKFNMD